ncbi:hypothetical protein NW762_001442 [Fusarium torreyae]|uniref:MYND-type zinc finger protein samB n=1 Tax=Fusarium torreyae TaxID=1237075 RepID=A0A9W8SCI2_9HYPO|nr:hypothetical protein NW762_001442 [Fusarium torreyae]
MSDTDVLYVLRDIPGKGRGLVAASRIPKGTRILAESPLFRIPLQAASTESFRASIIKKVDALPEPARQTFFSLHNAHPEAGQVLGTIKTNAFPLGLRTPEGGLFLKASRINHAYKQNAQHNWNENIQKLTIHAIRDIEEGSEITIMYLGERLDYAARQLKLKTDFGFDCTCDLCSLPLTERMISDSRIIEIQKLDKSFGDGSSVLASPLQALHNVQKLVDLFKLEDITDVTLSQAYRNAFQVAVVNKDLARAKVFAERSLSARVIVEGHDTSDVEKLERLIKDPSRHESHGISARWESEINDIPQDLEENDFENWLWRVEQPQDVVITDLRNELDFPCFEDLPPGRVLGIDPFQPNEHWAFLGEIVHIDALWRVRLTVKDKAGHRLPIAFYTDDRGREIAPSMLRVGYTVAILYPEQHGFLDSSVGIRHEDQKLLKVFPVSLDNLMLLSDKMQVYAMLADGKRTCHGCNKDSASLMKCAKCDFFWYCDKDCQTRGWVENGHKADCKLLRDPDLKGLFLLKWDEFEDYMSFPLTFEE